MTRKSMFVVAASVLASVGFAACGGNAKTSLTPAPAAKTAAATIPAAKTAAAQATSVAPASSIGAGNAGAGKLKVTGGALGGIATATMHTAPAASCAIEYVHPSGKLATAAGLTPKAAGTDGVVSWTWTISSGTKPLGTGTVTVTCGADKATVPIVIVASTN